MTRPGGVLVGLAAALVAFAGGSRSPAGHPACAEPSVGGEVTGRTSCFAAGTRVPAAAHTAVSAAARQQDDPSDLVAFAGHGAVFDKNMKEIRLDSASVEKIQDAILQRIENTDAGKADMVFDLKEARALLSSQQLTPVERIVTKAGMIVTLLTDATNLSRYAATHTAVWSNYRNRDPQVFANLRPDVLDLARRLGVMTKRDEQPEKNTFYMNLCRLARVPVPPDWAETGTPWVLQGELTTKLILGEKAAAVWTYSDPEVRGACIALPRGTGGPGDQLGIICQGAYSSAACFWDNIDRSSGELIEWHGRTLVISELQDGTNLADGPGRCTACHRGDNVFLITPDDPTWAKVIRGPLEGARTGTFTTRLEPPLPPDPDYPYFPLTGWPDRTEWVIPRLTTGCALGCHLESGLFRDWALRHMPPECARAPDGGPIDVRRCYGTP